MLAAGRVMSGRSSTVTLTRCERPAIDGEALVRARRRGVRQFEKLVAHYRALGATDPDLIAAMVRARGLISTLKLRGRP
jgi:hypothetical protein